MTTVDKALKKGWLLVSIPVIIILLGIMGLMLFLLLFTSKIIFIPAMLGSPLIAWIYWSFAITKWRIWAFSNVDDVNDLKHRAICEFLIWEDGNFFEKTEIRTKKQRILIYELEKRFKENKKKKHFIDDLDVPLCTKIYYSKLILIYVLLMIACIAVGLYLLVTTERQILGIALTIAGAFYAISNSKNILNFEPQIIIDDKALEIKGVNYSWSEIQDYRTTLETFGTTTSSHIIIETTSQTIKQNIDDYNTTFRELKYKLDVYKGRFEKATNHAPLHIR